MKVVEEKILVDGPVGRIEVIMESPTPPGIALVAHPHPIGGGANTNKVAYTLARTFVAPTPPSVPISEASAGPKAPMTRASARPTTCWPYSRTPGAVAATCRSPWPGSPSAPIARPASPGAWPRANTRPSASVLVGTAAGFVEGTRSYETEAVPHDTIVIHGSADETVPAERPRLGPALDLPVVVVPAPTISSIAACT